MAGHDGSVVIGTMDIQEFWSSKQVGGKGPPRSAMREAVEAMAPGTVLVFAHETPCSDSQRCPLGARMHRIKVREGQDGGRRKWATRHVSGDFVVACYTRGG